MDSPPFFSVLITNFNYARFVGEAIGSVLAQDYPAGRFEVIVVDDGSTDDSRAVIESFAADTRVRAVFQPNRGQSAAFAAGLDVARGDFVCLLDSDDLYLPGKLDRVSHRIAGIDPAESEIFLCHDLAIEDSAGGASPTYSWLALMGVTELGCSVDQVVTPFPFSIPSGIVLSRALAQRFFASLPGWAFTRGTDGVLCPAALIACGRVHYLHETLSVYRVHGGNEYASVVGGRYVPRFDARARLPKTLRFLEQWIDLLGLEGQSRSAAQAYLRRLEFINHMASESRRLEQPLVSVAVLAGADNALAARSIEAGALQSHGAIELVLPEGQDPGPAGAARKLARFADDQALPDHARLARAYAAASGAFVMFVRAGDTPDRDCVERHLHAHRQAALVGVTVSDIRLVDRAGGLLHADVFAASGAWKEPARHIPPLATGLGEWGGAPLSASMFRKGELLQLFFTRPGAMPAAVCDGAFWIMMQLAQQTSGLMRLRETLTAVVPVDGAAATYGYLSAPAGLDGRLSNLQVREAALWLQEFYLDHEEAFLRWLPAAWHRGFEPWLDRHTT